MAVKNGEAWSAGVQINICPYSHMLMGDILTWRFACAGWMVNEG